MVEGGRLLTADLDEIARGARGERGAAGVSTTRTLQRGRIGESVLRADGVPKVRGEFAYSSDLHADGMLWGATLRSPHPSAAHPRHRPHPGR